MTRTHLALAVATLAALGLAAAPAARAQTAYVDSFNASSRTDSFGTIDLQTGLFTSIDSNIPDELYALGFGSDGNLYGLGPDGSSTDLIQISTTDGTETLLQTFNNVSVYGGGITDGSGIFTAITSANSQLRSSLFTLDPVAQTETDGPLTFADADGLVVTDGKGNAFVSDINITASGNDGLDSTSTTKTSTTFLGDTGLKDVYTGVLSAGSLYTFAYDPNIGQEGVYTLNTTDGSSSLVAFTSNDEDILAAALAPAAAPEPSQFAAFGIGLFGLGALTFRAKKRHAA